MKPDFALNLSHEGLSLLRRSESGWRVMGEVALDAPDMSSRLGALRRTANELSDGSFTTKLLIPNSEILYRELEIPEAPPQERAALVAEALDGLTPYALDELAHDWEPAGPGRIRLAAVTLQILGEAEEFAIAQGFNPLYFTAIPPEGAFLREPFFGTIRSRASWLGNESRIGPEAEPVRILGADGPAAAGAGAASETSAPPQAGGRQADGPGTPSAGPGGARPAQAPAASAPEAAAAGLLEAPGIAAPAAPAPAGPAQQQVQAEMEAAKAAFFTARNPAADTAATEQQVGARLESMEPRILLYPETARPDGEAQSAPAEIADLPPQEARAAKALATGLAEAGPIGEDRALAGIGARREAHRRSGLWLLALIAAVLLALILAGLWLLRPDSRTALPPADAGGESLSVASAPPPPSTAAPDAASPAEPAAAPITAAPIPDDPIPDDPIPADAETQPAPAAAPAEGSAPAALPRSEDAAPPGSAPARASAPADGSAPARIPQAARSLPPAPQMRAPQTSAPQPPAGASAAQSPALETAHALRLPAPAPLTQPPGAARPLPEQAVSAPAPAGPAPGAGPAPNARISPLADATDPAAPPDLERDRITTLFVPGHDAPIRRQAAPVPALLSEAGPDGGTAPTADPLPLAQLPPPPPGTRIELDERGLVAASKEGTLNPYGIRVYAGAPPRIAPLRPEGLDEKARRAAARAEEEARKARARRQEEMRRFRPRLRPASIAQENGQATGGTGTPSAPQGATPSAAPAAPDQTQAPPQRPDAAPALTPQQAAMKRFRPRPRPDGLARAVQAALKEALPAPAPPPAGLKRPVPRPANFSSAISRALAAAGAGAAPKPSAPAVTLPTKASVAQEATLRNAIGRHGLSLIGVFGKPSDRRALVRLRSGRMVKVKVGDRIDGGQVAEIGSSSLKLIKRGQVITLRIPS